MWAAGSLIISLNVVSRHSSASHVHVSCSLFGREVNLKSDMLIEEDLFLLSWFTSTCTATNISSTPEDILLLWPKKMATLFLIPPTKLWLTSFILIEETAVNEYNSRDVGDSEVWIQCEANALSVSLPSERETHPVISWLVFFSFCF